MEQRIGYRHLEKSIMEAPNLPEERKEAWKKFEDVRDALYARYRELVKENLRLSNAPLESALREVTCRESNKDTVSVIEQWKEVIERYAQEEKAESMKVALLEVLDQFSKIASK
ncbi:MAG: hypothetical protein ACTSUC_00145 [Promethearchaeota archaeon]